MIEKSDEASIFCCFHFVIRTIELYQLIDFSISERLFSKFFYKGDDSFRYLKTRTRCRLHFILFLIRSLQAILFLQANLRNLYSFAHHTVIKMMPHVNFLASRSCFCFTVLGTEVIDHASDEN